MNISMVLEATENTQGVSGPSEINAVMQMARDVSRDFGDASNNLCNAIASLTKKICIEEIDDSSLSPLIAPIMVPLNKNPDLCPIGVRKVLWQVVGKIVMNPFSENVTTASSDAQM